MNLDLVLAQITPTAAEIGAMDQIGARLLARCKATMRRERIPGEPTIQGSIAKGTWLAGNTDIDLFLLLEPHVPEADLLEITKTVAEGTLEDCKRRYAQHPYLIGSFEGMTVDLVPAYHVKAATEKMSAVDRTPFHTDWVLANTRKLQPDVRLLKRWCKGVGIYGAETAIGGFSGYLLEVLVVQEGGFEPVLRLLRDAMSLQVADPVDAARDCAASVTADTLATTRRAAAAYLDAPSAKFFFPAPARPEPWERLAAALSDAKEVWCGLEMTAKTDRLDIVLPQFQRAARSWATALERRGFAVHRHHLEIRGQNLLAQFVCADVELPADRWHEGPPGGGRHADRFREKWSGHPDAVGPVEDDPLGVRLRVVERRPAEALASIIKSGSGRHVKDALGDALVLLVAPDGWDSVADSVLGRDPWER